MVDKEKPVVEVKDTQYQPTKAELEEDIRINTSPEELLKAVVRDVKVRITKKKK